MFTWWTNAEIGIDRDGKQQKNIKFTILGKHHSVGVEDVDPYFTLNDYLRQVAFLKGTKRMCYEGGCGSCIVAVRKPKATEYMAVNSCLVALLTCHGWKIDTIEGIGGPLIGYNPIQTTLASFNGTQCGFCSPAMVMNMYALMKNGNLSDEKVENSFGGNLCRCTGYRPILSAFKSLVEDSSKKLDVLYPDIEDFVCLSKFPSGYSEEDTEMNKSLVMKSKKTTWVKVLTLRDLLKNLSTIGQKPYMLVAGNTSKGVYAPPKASVFIDVMDVKELISYEVKKDVLYLGGNTSLKNTMKIFYEVAEKNKRLAYLKTMADHIDLVANVGVRNIGTVAGNLMIKYAHHEFPSDIFLLLETFAAELVIVDSNGKETTKNLVEFLKYDMNKRVIKLVQFSGLSADYEYRTYKIMPRAQNSHAIVNAGLIFQLNQTKIVQNARIVFGNINPDFIHAEKTEKALIGKEIFTNETLQQAFDILAEEVQPDTRPPEANPEFRKQLAISLFYKALLSMCPIDKLSSRNISGRSTLKRPLSNGIQEFGTDKSLYPLTEPIPKLEALAQTSGQAEYIEDIPDYPTQLHGKLVMAEAPPKSEVVKIDASKALALKGVVAFFTKDDIPGDNNFYPTELGAGIIEKIFCDGIVDYYHQPVGIVIASERSILSEAVGLIDIKFKVSNSKPLLTIRDLVKAQCSDRIIQKTVRKPTKIGTDIKHKLSGSFDLESQAHFQMELQCCLVIPTEDGLTVHASTQWMDHVQISCARMLKIPQNRISVKVRRCGGAFGAKISRNTQISCAAVLAAYLLKKPVRLSLYLKENMELVGKRLPFSSDYEVSVNDAGVIQHLVCKVYSDYGDGGNEQQILGHFVNMFTSNYNDDAFDFIQYMTRTEMPGNTFARAPGSLEGLAFIESIMDHIAYELEMDPLDVRINNITKKRELLDYLADMLEWADIEDRKHEIDVFNKQNRWRKKGISIVPMAWVFVPLGPYVVTISIFHSDGSVGITHGGIEIGQGINTKAAQVCAYRFNIPLDKVIIYPSSTRITANCMTTGSSVTTEAVCYAVLKACDELLSRMEPYRKGSSQTWKELITTSYDNAVLLTASSQYSTKEPFVNNYNIYGTCAAEVEVDVLTGQHLITRVDVIEDTGTSLSPLIDIGQVEGAFIMGIGYYTTEKLIYNEDGRLLTNNTWTYYPPGPKDIPINFRIKFPENKPNPLGILQSKATGEPPQCMSVSVPLAIRNALASARMDSDPSQPRYFTFDGPTTVETTFMNSLNAYKQYTL